MKQIINADPHGKIALQGYDPVSFHTVGKAEKGNPYIAAEYQGYKYLFASDANKTVFEKNPEPYLPAYGGFCAFGVSLGVLFPVEIDTWTKIDGKLVLQYNADIRKKFEEDSVGNRAKAEANWKAMTL